MDDWIHTESYVATRSYKKGADLRLCFDGEEVRIFFENRVLCTLQPNQSLNALKRQAHTLRTQAVKNEGLGNWIPHGDGAMINTPRGVIVIKKRGWRYVIKAGFAEVITQTKDLKKAKSTALFMYRKAKEQWQQESYNLAVQAHKRIPKRIQTELVSQPNRKENLCKTSI